MGHRSISKSILIPIVVAFSLLLSVLIGISIPTAEGAPSAIGTPIVQYPMQPAAKHVDFWEEATALTADTRSSCVGVAGYSTIDLHYNIDQGTVNTTTLTLEFSVIDARYPDGVNVVATNAADAEDIKQYNVFGEEMCLYADLTNSNAWTVTAQGVLK